MLGPGCPQGIVQKDPLSLFYTTLNTTSGPLFSPLFHHGIAYLLSGCQPLPVSAPGRSRVAFWGWIPRCRRRLWPADTTEAAEVLRTGVVLEAGEIDSSTVAVGALVVAIHGQGERHPVCGEWGHLVTVKGYVQAVDAGTLTLSRTRDGRPERIALEHIQTLVLVEAPSQDEPADFLAAKEMHRPLLSHRAYRLPAKVAAGTGWGIVFTGMAIGVQASTWENRTAHDGIGVFLYSVAIGCSVGFPLGVTSVDGYDSLPGTLLAGVIPAAAGVGMIAIDQEIDQERLGTALLLIYVAPVFGSLMVSEIWRNPPDYRGRFHWLGPHLQRRFLGRCYPALLDVGKRERLICDLHDRGPCPVRRIP